MIDTAEVRPATRNHPSSSNRAIMTTGWSSLPPEIRNAIFEQLFRSNGNGLTHFQKTSHVLDETYTSKSALACLLACRSMYNDASLLAFHQVHFVVTNLFINIRDRLQSLPPAQLHSLRYVSFVADARHLSKLHVHYWREHAFGLPALQLDTLTIILHRSSAWHYLFDYTANLVQLLRQLKGVKRLVFVRNRAFVKGSFKTWYNRLVGLMLKVDHQQRYMIDPPQPEKTWWTWSFDEEAQSFCMTAMPAKPMVDETTYIENILPLAEALRVSIENEEWNPDPRSWNGT